MPSTLGIVASGYNVPVSADTILGAYHRDWPAWSVADAVSGMTFTRTAASTNLGGGSAGQNGTGDADDGDYMDFLFDVEAGTFTLTVIYLKSTTFGIVEPKIDGTSLGTFDGYNGSATDDNVVTFTSIALTAGVHTLRLLISSKHASATDFLLGIQWLSLDRTGA